MDVLGCRLGQCRGLPRLDAAHRVAHPGREVRCHRLERQDSPRPARSGRCLRGPGHRSRCGRQPQHPIGDGPGGPRTMTSVTNERAQEAPGAGTVGDVDHVWIVLPTYNEADNLPPISAAILAAVPAATLLVVDDGSPDGTGQIADSLAAVDGRIRVRHRAAKQGLGRAYLDGFQLALAGGATIVVQMDADWSHDPAVLPALVGSIVADDADLVIGSRY